MSNALRLYARYIAISIRGQMQYRASFAMLSTGYFLMTGLDFAALWVLFSHFGSIQGWKLPEVALLYGMVNIAFALAEGVARGFDTFGTWVRSGDFDRILLRPRSSVLQLMGQEFHLLRIGRFLQALAVLHLGPIRARSRLVCQQDRPRDGGRSWRRLPLHRPVHPAGHPRLLDHRRPGNRQRSHQRRHRDCPVPPVDLSRMVPTFLHVLRPACRRQLLPCPCHSGPGRSLRLHRMDAIPVPAGGSGIPVHCPPRLEIRRASLSVHGQLTL